eukprot:XP_001710304.1 Hypothetical protein GL50803_95190 [Giardia lamblia ATCC 50803]
MSACIPLALTKGRLLETSSTSVMTGLVTMLLSRFTCGVIILYRLRSKMNIIPTGKKAKIVGHAKIIDVRLDTLTEMSNSQRGVIVS